MAKKRRRRTRPRQPAAGSRRTIAEGSTQDDSQVSEDAAAGDPAPTVTTERRPATRQRSRRDIPDRPRGRLSERMRAPSPYPPLKQSLARGFVAVGTSPAILLVALVTVGAIWLGLIGAGMEVFPRTLVEALALPPISSFYSDVLIPAGVFGVSLPAALSTLVLTLVRAIVWSILVGMIIEALEYGRVSVVGFLQGLRAFPSVLVIIGTNGSGK